MPVHSEGGKSRRWQRVVELLRETKGRSQRSPMGIQMRLNSQQNNPASPLNPQPPGEEGTLSHLQMRIEAFQLNLKNLFSKLAVGMNTESHETQNPHAKKTVGFSTWIS